MSLRKLVFVFCAAVVLVGSASASLVVDYSCDDDLTSSSTVVNSAVGGWGDGTAGKDVTSGIAGVEGTSFDFENSDAAFVDTMGKLTATGDFTLAGWTKLNYTARTILFGQYGGGESGRTILYSSDDRYGNVARFGIWDGSGSDDLVLLGTTAMDDDAWHHLAVTREGDLFTLYVDGAAEASGSLATSIYQGVNLAVGNLQPIADGAIVNPSAIDNALVYTNALSAAEVAALVPEPATVTILALGAVSLFRRKRN